MRLVNVVAAFIPVLHIPLRPSELLEWPRAAKCKHSPQHSRAGWVASCLRHFKLLCCFPPLLHDVSNCLQSLLSFLNKAS